MTSMDKRQEGAIGRPKKKAYAWVILRQENGHTDVTLHKVFTNRAKAEKYVFEMLHAEDTAQYRAEQWALE